MTKIKLLLLTLLSIVMPMSLSAYTKDQIVHFGANHYKVVSATENTLYFLGTDDSSTGELEIPGTIPDGNGTTFKVIGVSAHSLYRSINITSVKLPETIERLEGASFRGARLERINIPKSVKYIAPYAWGEVRRVPKHDVATDNPNYCSDSQGALYSKNYTTLQSVPSDVNPTGGVYTVDSRVQKITNPAFRLIEGLKKIVLPKDLKEIKDGYPTIAPTSTLEAFEIAGGGDTPYSVDAGVLFKDTILMVYPPAKPEKTYTVPNNITTIGSDAFLLPSILEEIDLNNVRKLNVASIDNAAKLTKITLPKGIKTYNPTTKMGMAEGCFTSCKKVEEYIVPNENTDFVAEDGVVYSKPAKDILYFYPPNKAGETYAIPASVKKMAQRCFILAQNITSMVIPKNVESLGQEAFLGARELKTVTFEEPSKITELGFRTFGSCPKLTTVTFPTSLKKIGVAFLESPNLETINVPNGSQLEEISDNAFTTNTKLKAFNIQGSCPLKTIGHNAFANLKELEKFEFPKTVTTINSNAFSGCEKMATATFADDAEIQTIGSGAFADCGLVNFNVPKNVNKIEREAFRNCAALDTVNISEATTDISPEAFKNCSNLKAINVSKKNSVYSSVDGYLLSQNKKTLIIFPPGKANDRFTLLPPSITSIGKYAFYDCKNLKNVTIPNLVTSIGERAFGLCTNLKTITFLCDEKIKADSINKEENKMSFDDGTQTSHNMFQNINIQVRKEKLNDYNSDPFYQKFKSIKPSFEVDTEEYIAVSDNAVNMLNTKRTDETFVLPTEIPHDGKNYKVSMIGDYAFQHVTSGIKEVVVKKDVEYIGAQAFITNRANNTSIIKSVFFIESNPTNQMLSTTRFELDQTNTNYSEFAKATKIYVKKTALNKYKAKWAKTIYKKETDKNETSPYDFTSQLDYQIKDVKISKKYGTFAREFDVDFSDYYNENHRSEIAAFVASTKILDGKGDYGTATKHVRMTSVDKNDGYTGSYSYVPAYTGVLLKVLDKEATDADFYYTIGEQDQQVYHVTNNVMTGVTVNPITSLTATTTDPIYVMQGGTFRKAESNINNFPIHKAYMKFSALPAGTRVVFDFDDTTTGIESIESIDTGNSNRAADVYYNLQGQRINKPQQAGLYILNGAKVIIK